MHREALQTTDMPLLCHTLQALLQVRGAGEASGGRGTRRGEALMWGRGRTRLAPARSQWGLSGAPAAATIAAAAGSALTFPAARSLTSVGLRFLLPLSRLMDGMHERKVVAEVLRSNVFELAVRFIDARGGAEAEPGDLLAGLEGLAGIVSSEEFTTQKVRRRRRQRRLRVIAVSPPATRAFPVRRPRLSRRPTASPRARGSRTRCSTV